MSRISDVTFICANLYSWYCKLLVLNIYSLCSTSTLLLVCSGNRQIIAVQFSIYCVFVVIAFVVVYAGKVMVKLDFRKFFAADKVLVAVTFSYLHPQWARLPVVSLITINYHKEGGNFSAKNLLVSLHNLVIKLPKNGKIQFSSLSSSMLYWLCHFHKGHNAN